MKRTVVTALLLFLAAVLAPAETQDPEFVKAQTLESQGKLDEARSIYESLYEARPSDLYFWKLVGIYERTGDYRAMERVALRKLKDYPDDMTTLNYLARACHGMGDDKRARKVLLDGIGEKWSDMDRVRIAANEAQGWSDIGFAIDIYQLARRKTGNPQTYALDLARLYTVQMNYVKALEEYLKIIEVSPPALANVDLMLKASFGSQADAKSMAGLFEDYLASHPKSVKAARLLFTLKQRLGDVDGAVRTLLDASVAAGNPEEVWGLAERMSAEGRLSEALEAYDRIAAKFPSETKRAAALLKSAAIRMSLGDRAAAERDYRTLIDEYAGKPEAQLAALRLMEIAGEDAGLDVTGKLRAFAESASDRGVAYEAWLLLADRCLRAGKTGEAADAVAKARLKARSAGEIYDTAWRAAMIRFYSGEFEEMVKDIETCVANAPEGEESNDLLSLRLLSLRASAGNGAGRLATYARGRFALYRGLEREGVDSLMVAASDTASSVAPEAARVLGAWWREKGENRKALEWYTRAIAAASDTTLHVAVMMDAAELYLNRFGDRESAKRLYVEALTAFPGSVFDAELRSRLRGVAEK